MVEQFTFDKEFLEKLEEYKEKYTYKEKFSIDEELFLLFNNRRNCNYKENDILNRIEKDLNIDYGYCYNLYLALLGKKKTNYKGSSLFQNLINISEKILERSNALDFTTDNTGYLIIKLILASLLEYIYFNKSFSMLDYYYTVILELKIEETRLKTLIETSVNSYFNIGEKPAY